MAQDKMKDKPMAEKPMKMDANNDGMVSEKEFMDYHKAMWGKIKRDAKGMARMEDVNMVYGAGGTVKP